MASQDFSDLLSAAPSATPANQAPAQGSSASKSQDAADFSALLSAAPDAPKQDGMGSLFDSLIMQESGGKQLTAKGLPLTSSRGAIGKAQVMPGTAKEAAALAGVPYDDIRYRTDSDYNELLGRAYFGKQLSDFGDPAKALAAYNAGPGAVRAAIAAAERNGNPQAWLNHLPAETRAYVPAIINRAGKSPSRAAVSQDDTHSNTYREPVKPRGVFGAINDSVIDAANAAAGLVKAGSDLVSPGNPVSEFIDKEIIKAGQENQSDYKKDLRRQLSSELKAAGQNDGTTSGEVAAEFRKAGVQLAHAITKDPLGTFSEMFGNIGPFAILGQGMQAARLASAARTAISAAAAGGLSAGEVRGNIWEKINGMKDADLQAASPAYAELRRGGMVEADAKREIGANLSRNLPEVAIVGAIGALSGKFGPEAMAAGVAPKYAGGRAASGVLGFMDEGPLQGGSEQVASNYGVQRAIPSQSLLEDVGQNVIAEGIPGAGMGVAFGGGNARAKPAIDPALKPVIDKSKESNSPLSKAAVEGIKAQPAPEAQPAAQDPAQRLAELEQKLQASSLSGDEVQEYKALRQVKDDNDSIRGELAGAGTEPQDSTRDRASQIEQAISTNNGLSALRQPDSPINTKQFLNDLAIAKSKSSNPAAREQALSRLEFAAGWMGVDLSKAAPAGSRDQVWSQEGKSVLGGMGQPDASGMGQQDEISKRVSEIENEIRSTGTIGALRSIGQSGMTEKEFLEALSIAKNPEMDKRSPQIRKRALESVEMGMKWAREGKMPGLNPEPNFTFGNNNPAGTDLTVPGSREVGPAGAGQFFDPNVIDGEATRVDENRLPGPRAITGPKSGVIQAITPESRSASSPAGSFPALGFTGTASPAEQQNVAQATPTQGETKAQEAPAVSVSQATSGMPRVVIPQDGGSGTTAVRRKRKAQLGQLVQAGFGTVEKRGDSFVMHNIKTGQSVELEGVADVQMARQAISQAQRAQADTSPNSPANDKTPASEAQIAAGNYAKPSSAVNGITVRYENPKGSTRSGVDSDGVAWSITMQHDYGHDDRVVGADGDKLDIFVGDHPASSKIFVIDQQNPDGSFDEHKVVLGARNEDEARKTYLSNYESGWTGLGAITELTREQYDAWTEGGKVSEPIALGKSDVITLRDAGQPVKVQLIDADEIGKGKQTRRDSYVLTKQDASIMSAIGSALGIRTAFFRGVTPGFEADGIYTQGNTILMGEQYSRGPMSVFLHEFTHLMENQNPKAYGSLMAVVRSRVADPKGYRADYYGKQYAEQKGAVALSDDELRELIGDLGGDMMNDAAFWGDVFADIQAKNGKEAQGIIAKLAEFLNDLLQKAVAAIPQKAFGASKFVNDASEIREAFRTAVASYMEENGFQYNGAASEIFKAAQMMAEQQTAAKGAPQPTTQDAESPQTATASNDGIKIRAGKGLIQGKFNAEVDGDVVPGGPFDTEQAAQTAALEWRAKTYQRAKDSAAEKQRRNTIAQKFRDGQSVTAIEIKSLGLPGGTSDVKDFFSVAADLFGLKSRDIRPIVKDLIRVSTTDMGAKHEYVATRKALETIGKSQEGEVAEVENQKIENILASIISDSKIGERARAVPASILRKFVYSLFASGHIPVGELNIISWNSDDRNSESPIWSDYDKKDFEKYGLIEKIAYHADLGGSFYAIDKDFGASVWRIASKPDSQLTQEEAAAKEAERSQFVNTQNQDGETPDYKRISKIVNKKYENTPVSELKARRDKLESERSNLMLGVARAQAAGRGRRTSVSVAEGSAERYAAIIQELDVAINEKKKRITALDGGKSQSEQGQANPVTADESKGPPSEFASFEAKMALLKLSPELTSADGGLNERGKALSRTPWGEWSESDRALALKLSQDKQSSNDAYNARVREDIRQIERRQMQGQRTITQANGKPFKTEASAKVLLDQFDLIDTHKIVSEGGGYALRQMPAAEQAEVRRKAEGRESYMEAHSAVAKEMGIKESDDGEMIATDEQFDELERRTAARLRGEKADDLRGKAKPPILQNRNRSTPSSIAQMQSIASRPDYGRLGFSRDFANGAPVVAGGSIPAAQLGAKDVAVASDGRRIPIQYAVIDASSILASNRADGTPNADYADQSIDRVRAIAGNGRVAGMQAAYSSGTTIQYEDELANDMLHGVSREAIRSLRQPVLVRVMPSDQVTDDIGDVSNTVGNLSLSPVEQANNDAQRVNLDALQFSEDGGITSETVRQFVRSMPQAEQGGLIDTNGQPTRQAVDRLNAAVFAKAYGNDQLVRLYAQASDQEARNILSALSQVAPKMARLDGAGSLDVREIVTQAAEIAINSRRRGDTLDRAAAQIDMAADPDVGVVLQLFADNTRTVRPVVEALGRMADMAYSEANKPNEDMFGAVQKAGRQDIINQLKPENERESKKNLEIAAGGKPAQVNADRGETQAGAQGNAAAPEGSRASQAQGLTNLGDSALILTAPTPEEIVARQDAAEAAQRAAEAAERKANEDERKRQERDEVRARSNAAADTFELGMDPMENLTGQQDIFSMPAPVQRTEKQPPASPYTSQQIASAYVAAEPAIRGKTYSNITDGAHKARIRKRLTDLGLSEKAARDLVDRATAIHASQPGATSGAMTFLRSRDLIEAAMERGLVADRAIVSTANDKLIGKDINGHDVFMGTDGPLNGVPYSLDERGRVRTGVSLDDATMEAIDKESSANTSPLASHASLMALVREGRATPEQFKAGFDFVVNRKDEILAELDAKTKVQLLREGGPYMQMRHANDKKADVVDAVYHQILAEYALGESVTYGMGKDSYKNAVGKLVEATDEDKLDRYVQDRKAAIEEAAARREARSAAIKNPQTLEDFRLAIKAKVAGGMTKQEAFLSLTPGQRIQFDTLEAESTRAARDERKRGMKSSVSIAQQSTGGQILSTKHTRDGYDLFVVQLSDRLSADDYKAVLASAKKLGGWYSSFRGNGATPGFQFKDRASAEAFLSLAGGDSSLARSQIEQRQDVFEDDRSQTVAERLRSMADKLEEQANEEEGRSRKSNTARRARFASAALAAAAADKAKARTMRNIAQAIESGKANFLDQVRTKSQVEMLASIVDTAKANELRAKYDDYSEQEKRKGEPPTAETADFAEFPSYTAFRSDLAMLGRQLIEVDGTKKIGQRLMAVADDVTDAYLEFAKGNLSEVSQFGRGDSLADFGSKDDAERAIKRSGLSGKAIVLQVKRGQNRVILSPSEAIGRGVWQGDGDKRITLTSDFGGELVEAIGRRGDKSNRLTVPWQLQNTYDRRKALSRIGIETANEFRSALREFINLKEQATANRVRELELKMVGRRNDGLDFFPTSAEVADQMVDAADLSPDMAVLEPSAGMGHLADRIRAAGAEPDVIEISPERRELLEEKGYHLAEVDDFMSMEPRKFFTYGDVFRAPDGTEGIMRGVGHMGSQRVRLEDEDGNRLGLYDRSDMVGVRHRGAWSGYDRIIMNPPFSKRQDAEHVRHAYDLLKPGGRIVAIMGEGVFFGQDQKAQEFRDWLDSAGGTSEKLPDGSFMDPSLPVNTGVNARMVVIDKPASGQDAKLSRARADQNDATLNDYNRRIESMKELISCIGK